MRRIDFFTGATHRLKDAAQIAKYYARRQGRLCVYCSDAKRLKFFDLCLWDTGAEDFVSHVIFDSSLPEVILKNTIIWLVQSDLQTYIQTVQDNCCLLNLDNVVVPEYNLFDQVIEVVSEIQEDKVLARNRWKSYTRLEGNVLKNYDYLSFIQKVRQTSTKKI